MEKIIPYLTMDQLEEFCKTRNLDRTSCDSLSKYIRSLLELSEYVDQLPNIVTDPLEMQSFRGLYLMYQDLTNLGFHYFAVDVSDDTVTLLQTYGEITYDEITIKRYNKSEWIGAYTQALNSNYDAFKYIFDLPSDYWTPKKPGLFGITRYLKIHN